MTQKLQPVRGTHDLFGEEAEQYHAIIEEARRVGRLYGFKDFATPIFEFTEVFKRTLGDESDIVNKEMYSFDDKGGDSITLRPEFTAGIARAFISGGLQQHLPLKLFSHGPLFRYERPQKGRARQFHQVNFEYIGSDSPLIDAEVITLAGHILFNLMGKSGAVLHINSLGDSDSRDNYRKALVKYLDKFKSDLSEDSKRRLKANPLRILDSKDKGDKEIIKNAPVITEHLNKESKKRFNTVLDILQETIFQKVKVNPNIVRGLDYYSHTVFEFISESEDLGAQNTILAGGRYDGLIKQMGGNETPAFGFAAGIERLMLASKFEKTEESQLSAIIPLGAEEEVKALLVASVLRENGIAAEIISGGNIGKKFAKADKMGADFCIVIGQDEIKKDKFKLKNMQSGEEKSLSLDKIIEYLK